MAILGLQPLVFGGVEGVLFRQRCNGIVNFVWLSRKTLSQKKIYASNGVVIERYSLYSNYWRYTSHNQGSTFKLLEITYSIGKTKV